MAGLKTNKSFSKRIKVTRKGKVLSRKTGQNHFNAKASRTKQMKRRNTQDASNIRTRKELSSLMPLKKLAKK